MAGWRIMIQPLKRVTRTVCHKRQRRFSTFGYERFDLEKQAAIARAGSVKYIRAARLSARNAHSAIAPADRAFLSPAMREDISYTLNGLDQFRRAK